MRQLFLCALLCFLPILTLAQTTRDWADRVMSNDPKVRVSAEEVLVQRAGRSLPLLRRFINSGDEDLQWKSFEIIRRIGPPAIPLLVELLRDEQVEIRRL